MIAKFLSLALAVLNPTDDISQVIDKVKEDGMHVGLSYLHPDCEGSVYIEHWDGEEINGKPYDRIGLVYLERSNSNKFLAFAGGENENGHVRGWLIRDNDGDLRIDENDGVFVADRDLEGKPNYLNIVLGALDLEQECIQNMGYDVKFEEAEKERQKDFDAVIDLLR